MQKMAGNLTVYFDDPFWVCIYERIEGNRLEVCKITFGAEPKDYQIHEYLLHNWHKLRFSLPVSWDSTPKVCRNPKRLQRQIARQLNGGGVGTRSQQALKLQREQGKQARTVRSREAREQEKQRRFVLAQHKKKEKKKGH